MNTRQTGNLRIGRVSSAHTTYFITLCAIRPEHRLIDGPAVASLANAITHCEMEGDWHVKAHTIMPDHLHLLITLLERNTISRVVAKFKYLTTHTAHDFPIQWQRNFHEHRLRPWEIQNDFARYIFLNPYRANLTARNSAWPYWGKGQADDFDFLHQLDHNGHPPQEWLDDETPEIDIDLAGHD